MFKFNLSQFKTRFTLYYIFKSTAWITPIFFLFLQRQVHLDISQILKISGALMILPFILDIPLGALADYVGARKLLLAGTLMQFSSLLGFFILPSQVGYIAYLISIIVAENCYSGAEQSYLSQNLKSAQEVKDFLKQLNQYFYYITIPALVMGVVLFELNPYFPLYAQLASFTLAFLSIVGLRSQAPKCGHTPGHGLNFQTLKQDVGAVIRSSEVRGLILFGGVFASFVQISGKTIQGQLDLFASGKTGLWLVLSYVGANIASGSSLLFWRKFDFFKRLNIGQQVGICFGLFIAAQGLMLTKNIWLIFSGYVLLSGVKSVYRPLISGELVHNLQHLPRMATKLSVVSTSTMILVSGFHILSGYLMASSEYGLPILIAIISGAFAMGLYSFNRPKVFESYSGKQNLIIKVNGEKFLQQKYPNQVAIPNYKTVNDVAKKWHVKVPALQYATSDTLIFEFIEHELLSEAIPDLQLKICDQVLTQQMSGLIKKRIETEGEYNGSHFLEYFQTQGFTLDPLRQDRFFGFTHGDLNPNNIILNQNGIFFIVDWDLLDVGYTWYDGLVLITHPDLDLNLESRMTLLTKVYRFESGAWLQGLVREFYKYKYMQLAQFTGKPMQSLASRYWQQYQLMESSL